MAKTSLRILATACCIALLFAVASCRHDKAATAAAKPKPTKAQLKTEVGYMSGNITKSAPNYNALAKYLTLLFSTKYDLSFLGDATLLIPNNTYTKALLKKIPASQANLPKLYNVTTIHVLIKKRSVAALKALKQGAAVPTALKVPIFKQTPPSSALVSFGAPKSPPATWTTVRAVKLYQGPYFVAHGVDLVISPPGMKL
eukprot:TRINITY_DN54667_c0_g1_i2.p1 TRINITY_DN54667_c0_g1~~TRINITY_DN54667_c0_g1_i2.p1  ORF type:complete len:200 (-),score=21.54 TRINITY_DN54667_c0_g1_i2:123-722(-)